MTARVGIEVDTQTIRIPMRLQRRGGRKLIMTPEGVAAPARKPSRDETLVKALVRAHRWRRRIESGQAKSITDLAEQEGVTDAYVCRLLPLDLSSAGHHRGNPRRAVGGGCRHLDLESALDTERGDHQVLLCDPHQRPQAEQLGAEHAGEHHATRPIKPLDETAQDTVARDMRQA
jgi:hypothetical protein